MLQHLFFVMAAASISISLSECSGASGIVVIAIESNGCPTAAVESSQPWLGPLPTCPTAHAQGPRALPSGIQPSGVRPSHVFVLRLCVLRSFKISVAMILFAPTAITAFRLHGHNCFSPPRRKAAQRCGTTYRPQRISARSRMMLKDRFGVWVAIESR